MVILGRNIFHVVKKTLFYNKLQLCLKAIFLVSS